MKAMACDNNKIAVAVRDLTVRFGEFVAVNRVSFDVKCGEIFGFLGANGAGKTTTIRCLCGLLVPTSGSAVIGGTDVSADPAKVKTNVGYMSQKFTLYDDLTIAENLDFAASLRKLGEDFYERRVKELYDFIGLEQPKDSMIRDLPGGILQQVALVAATIHDPQIIFLDEPTAGVTPGHRALFWKLIKKLSEEGRTIFVTTHYMDEAEQCDRIALMRAGEIVAIGSPSELKKETFPEPIFEITPPENPPGDWLAKLKGQDFIDEVNVYGMRYHARLKKKDGWENYRAGMAGFEIKQIDPSLEDVFIRKIEGKNR